MTLDQAASRHLDTKSAVITRVAAALLLLGSPDSHAQAQARVHRVGFVSPLPASPEPPTLKAFREGLQELGYVEGRNLFIAARFAEGDTERMPDLVAQTLRQKVDVLVVGATQGALAAKNATPSVPVVFVGLIDPVGARLVASLARPGGNITGVTVGIEGPGFAAKWIELLKDAVPGISRVAVIANSTNTVGMAQVQGIQATGKRMNVTVDVFDGGSASKLEPALASIAASRAEALIVTNDPFFAVNRSKLIEFCAAKRLPAIYFYSLFAEAGGLMAYGGSIVHSYRRAATYVDKILKGAKPGDLPIEQPTRYEHVINLKAAKDLGLTIPQSLLLRADHLIQ